MISIYLEKKVLYYLIFTCVSMIWSFLSFDKDNQDGSKIMFANLHGLVSILTPIGLIVFLIIVFFKVNFISWLTYFSIAFVAAIVPGFLIGATLALILRQTFLQGIAPTISCIVSSYVMFTTISTL